MRTKLEEGFNQLLESELTAFLGYDPYAREGWNSGNSRNGSYFRKAKTQFGPIKVQVHRDRKGEFHQHTLLAYGQHTDALESTVIQLYSHGVTTHEISDLIEKMYGSHYSAGTVSNISKQVASQVESYHQRQLSDKLYLYDTYIPLRWDIYQREAVSMWLLGLNLMALRRLLTIVSLRWRISKFGAKWLPTSWSVALSRLSCSCQMGL